MDIVCPSVGLLVPAPVMLVIEVAIQLDSSGAILFGHDGLGLNGRRFRCYKLRSLRRGADAVLRSDPTLRRKYVANGYKLCTHEEPRLTTVGRFLRKTSIDELPQLLNVLKGETSLVGPRPIVPEELERYGHGAALFSSLEPGITRAWQVNGRSSDGYPNCAENVLQYVRNWSLAGDPRILLRTIPAVLVRRGAH